MQYMNRAIYFGLAILMLVFPLYSSSEEKPNDDPCIDCRVKDNKNIDKHVENIKEIQSKISKKIVKRDLSFPKDLNFGTFYDHIIVIYKNLSWGYIKHRYNSPFKAPYKDIVVSAIKKDKAYPPNIWPAYKERWDRNKVSESERKFWRDKYKKIFKKYFQWAKSQKKRVVVAIYKNGDLIWRNEDFIQKKLTEDQVRQFKEWIDLYRKLHVSNSKVKINMFRYIKQEKKTHFALKVKISDDLEFPISSKTSLNLDGILKTIKNNQNNPNLGVKQRRFLKDFYQKVTKEPIPPRLGKRHTDHLLYYLLNGMKRSYEDYEKDYPKFTRDIDAVERKRQNSKYVPSLTPFKKGDLRYKCKKMVDRALALGFKEVMFFYPVHYVGAFVKPNAMSGVFAQVKGDNKLVYSKNYAYPTANMIGQEELNFCLDYIYSNGLTIRQFVPHLESVVTMNGTGESEWRFFSGIPLDAEYKKRAFGPLINYYKRLKERGIKLPKKISLSLAAEIDPSFFLYPKTSLKALLEIKKEFKDLGIETEVTWSPNGDFFNTHPLEREIKKYDCKALEKLLSKIDRIAPSFYQRYQHIPKSGSYLETKKLFYKRLDKYIKTLSKKCSMGFFERIRWRRKMSRRLRAKKFSVTEMELKSDKKDYKKFHREFEQEEKGDPGAFIGLWTQGEFDPVGVSGDQPIKKILSSKKREVRDILGTLKSKN